jgi:predicted RNase H-like nuclease (RuvC/YqgF family)
VLHWTNDDDKKHVLYNRGTWKPPEFLTEGHGTRILTRNYRSRNPAPLLDEDVDDLPDISWTRSDQTLSEEGIAVSTLAEAYEESAKNQPSGTHATEQPPTEEPETTNKTAVPETHDREELLSEIEENQGAIESVENHLTTVEATVDEMRDTIPTTDALESRFTTLESKLSALETQLEEVPETIRKDRLGEQRIPGVVVRQDDLTLLRLHPEEADSLDNLEHGDEVEVVITETNE